MLCAVTGCGEPRTINGTHYDTVGLVQHLEGDVDPCIEYKVSMGNVIWGVLLIETIVAPIYFFGWSIMNPVSAKKSPECPVK
jgi:hypothetical protein